uniref:hypothetical protein n=1 Tax=Thaumasiovibrio occultus TaxID=1891184 RepID=UPI000B36153A|nr:hypothetical protein [Thaumasiovibrio occultus]
MMSYYVEQNADYQHKVDKRRGRAVFKEHGVVTLQSAQGENFVVEMDDVEPAPAREDANYAILVKDNAPLDEASVSLTNKDTTEQLGLAEPVGRGGHAGQWRVVVFARGFENLRGYFASRQSAINALWFERWHL